MLDQIFKETLNQIWILIPVWWSAFWPYILGFAVVILVGMVWQIIMFRSGSRNGLSSGFNSMVGSLFFGISFLVLLGICYRVWGAKVIDEIWFGIIGAVSFSVTGLFLRTIGFWRY
jgi:hypothetical protein